jgi:MFS family permease
MATPPQIESIDQDSSIIKESPRGSIHHDEKVGVLPSNTSILHSRDEDEQFEEDFHWNLDIITNLTALYLMYFAATWSLSIPASSIAFILRAYPASRTEITWVAAGPSLCLCVLQIFLGDLSDIFGRKGFLLVAGVLGTIGMILGGRANGPGMLIAGQVLVGFGMTIGYLTTPLLAEIVPKKHRATIIGGGTLMATVGTVIGSIAQGAFMKHNVHGVNQGWRVGFYLGAGFFFAALVTIFFFYRPGPRPNPEGLSVKERLLKFDWVGLVLGCAGLTLLLVALNTGGHPDPWNSAKILALLVVGIVILIAFSMWEWKGTKDRLFPESLFEHRNYPVALALNFIEGMVIFGSQAFLSQIILALLTKDYVMTAVYNLPSCLGTIFGVAIAVVITRKTREAKWVAILGVVCLMLGSGLAAIMNPGSSFALWFFITLFIGAGLGILGTIIPVIMTVATPNRFIATAVALGTSIRGLGGAVGVVIFSQIYSSKLLEFLPRKLAAVLIGANISLEHLPEFVTSLAHFDIPHLMQIPGVNQQVIAVSMGAMAQAQADAFRFIWYSLLPFGGTALIMSLFLKSTKEQITEQVVSHVRPHFRHKVGEDAKHVEEKET